MGYPLGRKRNGASRFLGVYRSGRKKNPWMVQIRVEGRLEYRGMFATEEEAARAYNRAARVYGYPLNPE